MVKGTVMVFIILEVHNLTCVWELSQVQTKREIIGFFCSAVIKKELGKYVGVTKLTFQFRWQILLALPQIFLKIYVITTKPQGIL